MSVDSELQDLKLAMHRSEGLPVRERMLDYLAAKVALIEIKRYGSRQTLLPSEVRELRARYGGGAREKRTHQCPPRLV